MRRQKSRRQPRALVVAIEHHALGADGVCLADVRDNLANAVDESITNRPYTTLAMALALGFVFGATWRR